MYLQRFLPYLKCVTQRNIYYKNNTMEFLEQFQKFGTYRSFSSFSDRNMLDPMMENTDLTKKPKKKTVPIPKITLLYDENITVSTVEEAQKLAKRRDLKLVKILDLDTKTARPVYKLMSGTEYYAEDLKQREKKKADKLKQTFKGEKLLVVSQNIAEHDLQTQIKKILKWIQKNYEVRLVVNGSADNISKAEKVYSFLEKNLAEHCRILQKRQKGSDIKFQIIPLKQPKPSPSASDNNSNNDNDNDKKPI